jgi:hypothetical protein
MRTEPAETEIRFSSEINIFVLWEFGLCEYLGSLHNLNKSGTHCDVSELQEKSAGFGIWRLARKKPWISGFLFVRALMFLFASAFITFF